MVKGLLASFGMMLDPGSATEAAKDKWAWVGPLLLLAIVSSVVAWIVFPLSQEVMLKNPPEGVSREQLIQAQERMGGFAKIGIFVAPLVVAGITAALAGLMFMTCSVLGMQTNFLQLFNLTSMAGIIKVIAGIAMAAVLKMKAASIETAEELSPAFGLDIFLPDDTNKYLRAFLNYFSVFEIWFIVVLALAVAAMYKVSKGKGFGAVTLVWLLPLLMALAGAVFRR